MNKLEVLEMLEHMEILYPNKFEPSEKAVNVFYLHLEKQDYNTVLKNLMRHAKENKYVPTIADLIEQKQPYDTDNTLDQFDKWEADASGGPTR